MQFITLSIEYIKYFYLINYNDILNLEEEIEE